MRCIQQVQETHEIAFDGKASIFIFQNGIVVAF